jgi:hypothetical protein
MIVEGKFRYSPGLDPDPVADLTVVYSNKETGITYGVCPMNSSLFSKKTREALLQFIQSAEEDFGRAFFGEETAERGESGVGSYSVSESSQGMNIRYLGGA